MYCRCSSFFSWMGWTWLKPPTNKHDAIWPRYDQDILYTKSFRSHCFTEVLFTSQNCTVLRSRWETDRGISIPRLCRYSHVDQRMTCVQVSPYLDFKEKVLTETACLNSLFCCSRMWRDCGSEESICDSINSICMSLYVYNFPGW